MNQFAKELSLFKAGKNLIAGLDEAGRGPLAGPVVAACVIIDQNFSLNDPKLKSITDSKKLSAKKREELFSLIKSKALAVEIGVVDSDIIDQINVLQASFLAMRRAIYKIKSQPDYLLVDGPYKIPKIKIEQEAIIDGDANTWLIAAASIIAKVSRDWIMTNYDKEYPQYGFCRHKGYGTKEHLLRIKEYGPCPIHRFSFAPIKQKPTK